MDPNIQKVSEDLRGISMTGEIQIKGNPFELTKASDFTDEQIAKYFVDLSGGGTLEDLIRPTLKTPMLLLGGKGSGKTHLMRYFSAPVQKLRSAGNLADAVKKDGYIGIYVRADGLNVGRFTEKGQSEEQWGVVFGYYVDLWLTTQLLRWAQECLQGHNWDQEGFIAGLRNVFAVAPPSAVTSLSQLIDHLTEQRRKVDYIVSNCVITKSLAGLEVVAAPGQLTFEIPELLRRNAPHFADTLFVYMIDEVENFSPGQQKYLNTLIRYRRGPVSIKIGARLYGIHTKQTLGSGESIKRDSEYEQLELDWWLRTNDQAYERLARALVKRRLEQASVPEVDPSKIEMYFETLDPANHYQNVTLALVKKYDDKGQLRPYLESLLQFLNHHSGLGEEQNKAIVQALRVGGFPLIEKVNTYLFYKAWQGAEDLLAEAERIGAGAKSFITRGPGAAPWYPLEHFKQDLLAQLYQDCNKQRVVYAGFGTLIQLSQGVPRNLLSLLKHIYRRSQFAEERPFSGKGPISIASQVEGIRDAAAWFWDDAQPDSHGSEVRTAIEALAGLFRGVRYSLKPAECDLGTFTVSASTGTPAARQILQHAENWSYLIKIRDGAVNRNDPAALDEKYQLSPMLAARWEISERRRGTIELKEDLFNGLFDPSHHDRTAELIDARLDGMRHPWKRKAKEAAQKHLF